MSDFISPNKLVGYSFETEFNKSVIVQFKLGLKAEQSHRLEMALAFYQKCIDMDAQFWPAYYRIGIIKKDYHKEWETAQKLFVQVLEINYSHLPTFQQLIICQMNIQQKLLLKLESFQEQHQSLIQAQNKTIKVSQSNPLKDNELSQVSDVADFENFAEKKFDELIINVVGKDLNFARNHHLCCKSKKFIYCYIPKNACTTFKWMVASYKEYNSPQISKILRGESSESINQYTANFIANAEDIANSKYFRFVILRSPFNRLVSAYCDKFVRGKAKAKFARQVVCKILDKPQDFSNITFEDFVNYLCDHSSSQLDQHWRPQVDFLLYKKYDMYIQMENLSNEIPKLTSLLEVDLPRSNQGHHSTKYSCYIRLEDTWKINANELGQVLESENALPEPKAFYNEDIIAKVRNRYQADCELYESLFGPIDFQ